jgi:hypothetical protein
MSGGDSAPDRYDRQLLLLGKKRESVLELAEVQRYGAESFGDPNYVSLYGLHPNDWYARGVRILGRTAVECTRDELADLIGRDVAALTSPASGVPAKVVVIDPFAGSANTLVWLSRYLPGARLVGFELDPDVFALTHRNLSLLELPIDYRYADYTDGLAQLSIGPEELVVAFVAPPWGHALSAEHGLDLRCTLPPVADIIEVFRDRFPQRSLFAIQTVERLVRDSLDELRGHFDWSAVRTYDLGTPGDNHGLLLGTSRWTPTADAQGRD